MLFNFQNTLTILSETKTLKSSYDYQFIKEFSNVKKFSLLGLCKNVFCVKLDSSHQGKNMKQIKVTIIQVGLRMTSRLAGLIFAIQKGSVKHYTICLC